MAKNDRQNSDSQTDIDKKWMARCLDLARLAGAQGEVPIGALVVDTQTGVVVSEAFNRREVDRSPIAHAELLAIQEASARLDRWRLTGCTLYVTLEPCAMCAGAIVLSRIDRVVYGALDPKAGAVTSVFSILTETRLNHQPELVGGVMAAECGTLLSEFFQARRSRGKIV